MLDIDVTGVERFVKKRSSVFPRAERFRFFDVVLRKPDWQGQKLLDIGGNCGNFILDCIEQSDGVEPNNYYCLDVDQSALDYGKSLCSEANWQHYDAFNHMYNPDGKINLPLPYEDNTFDFVLAYSVYSHTTYEQLIHDVSEMRRVCKDTGQIAFTFVDATGIEWFLDKRKLDYPHRQCVTLDDVQECLLDYKYLVDSDLLLDEMYSNKRVEHLVSVFHPGWLSNQLHNLGYENVVRFPTTGHVQKVIIIK